VTSGVPGPVESSHSTAVPNQNHRDDGNGTLDRTPPWPIDALNVLILIPTDMTNRSVATAFEERQSHPNWLLPAVIAVSVPAVVATAAVTVGEAGLTADAVWTVTIVVVLVVAPIPLLARSELRTTVGDEGICFRYTPFHRRDRCIRFDELTAVRRGERRDYQFGLRRTRWGWEYRPNASEGVELVREDGPRIFIGSERPYELLSAIEERRRNN